jgi:dienelactone hydrolase
VSPSRWLPCVAVALGACAGAELAGDSVAPVQAPPIPIEVMRPEGAGPFPAIVMLHDCSGLGPRSSGSPRRWAKLLVAEGYVVVIPDSFSTRGHAGGVCTNADPGRREVNPQRRRADAYAALAHARTLPYVDGKRVGVMGGSHGGASTLAAMAARLRTPRDGAPFAAGVALYPSCGRPQGAYAPLAPLLILTGELDDWTPADPCRALADSARAAGHPVSIKVYPQAHHAFDSDRPVRFVERRVNSNSATGFGATTGGNAAAWEDSIREVKAFFARHLR